ncbi:MAG: hypothetical protein LAQ69_07625 [Acidobacteriia bacterium]|nr:hypothetical protein [Terriglobia bacterium]
MSTSPINLSAPTLQDAINNQLAASTAQVARLNADLQTRFDQQVTDFNLNMASGQSGVNHTPPEPPFAWELAPADAVGFMFYQISKTTKIVGTVTPTTFNAYDASQIVKPKNVIDVGVNFFGKWFSVGPHDTFPSGMTTPPQADGHTYEKFAAPVGPGWYLQVS